MSPSLRQLYRQEIAEQTALLRDDPEWDDLRLVLRHRGVRPEETRLAAFMEDEYGMEYGVLVTADLRVIEYHRHDNPPRVVFWRDRTDDPTVVVEYPQVAVALELPDPDPGA